MSAKTATPPNIVLINCDDLGFGDLTCYGSTVNRTPAIDSLATDGVRFTNFCMASGVCSPSRGAMMTGCYPPRIGFASFEGRGVLFPGQPLGLSTEEVTLPTLLSRHGYATHMIGKWHCGDQKEFLPTRHGFDHYYGLPYSNDMGRQVGSPPEFPPLPLMRDEEVIQQQPDQRGIIERYTEEAVRFLRANRKNTFFLYLAHMQVHLPLYAPERFVRESQNGPYGACVEAINWSTAVLLEELRSLGLEENTLVIFTSDNGSLGSRGGSNGALRGNKGTTWDGGFRVPCVMRWPGRIAPGRVSGELLASIDFLPTLARLSGTREPDDRRIDGLDVSALLLDPDASSPRRTFLYYWKDNLDAVRKDNWKMFVGRAGKQARELYDLEHDIGETTNVYEKRPEVVRELMALVDETRRDTGDASQGMSGSGCRPVGKVSKGVPLTEYDPTHPYIVAMYDLPDRG